MTTIYQSSTGPKPIASMNYHNVKAAHAKLLRDDPSRLEEIEALGARLAELDAEHEKGAQEGAGAVSAPPAPMGHNEPPAPINETREALRVHIMDLYQQAQDILDGEAIKTQGEADMVAKLKGMIAEAEKAADAARLAEVKPLNDAKEEIQAFYNELIADNKTVTGKTVLAMRACQKALTPWLKKLEEERLERERLAKIEADRLAQAARDAAASAVSLDEVEEAEAMFSEAKQVAKDAANIGSDRVRAGVGTGYKAAILRDNYVTTLIDGQAALRHFWSTRRSDLEAFALKLAQEEVRQGKRTIPGFDIRNDPVAV